MKQTILSLKSKMSASEAWDMFRGRGVVESMRRRRRGQLARVLEVFIPYWLFHVKVRNRSRIQAHWLAIDLVTGQLDLHRYPAPLCDADVISVATEFSVPAVLPRERVEPLLLLRVRRQVYVSGFFRLLDFAIETEPVGREFHIPYWVGLYQKGTQLSLDVIDATRGESEGAKVRDVMQEFLSQ